MSEHIANPLSTTQTYRGIVHMTPYGWLDETVGKMWMLLYRCATTFEITIAMSDIEGTPFAARLAPYMIEPRNVEEQIQFLHKSHDKNSLIIEHLFETLNELAPPKKREWETLEDVLRTPTYHLSLHKPDKIGVDAIARIDLGPIIKPALAVLQAPFNGSTLSIEPGMLTSVKNIPASRVTFASSILSSATPESVILPTGEVVSFPEDEIENGDINLVSNPSHFAIRTYLRLQNLLPMQLMPTSTSVGVQRVLGIVTTGIPPPQVDEHGQVARDDAAARVQQQLSTSTGGETKYLVGLLLEPLPSGTKSLNDPATKSLVSLKPELADAWYTSLKSTMQVLHSQSPPLYHGNISPETILVQRSAVVNASIEFANEDSDIKYEIYLTGFSDNQNYDRFVPEGPAFTPQGDLDALENIFGASGWLTVELKKAAGELAEDFEWKRKDIV